MNFCTSKRPKGSPENNRSNNESERLSELPDSILIHILSFLPTIDAVRTMAIRRFGSLWTWLPSLEFHDSEFIDKLADAPNGIGEDAALFANFVRNVLFLHRSFSIETFKLCSGNDIDFSLSDEKFFDQEFAAWIRYAIDRQVKILYVSSYYSILPQCVFTSPYLVVLKLNCVQIDDLSRVQMRSLTKLSLHSVDLSNDEVLNKITLGSPSLLEMDLDLEHSSTELHFTAPNIKELTLASYYGSFDCPNLEILDIARTHIPRHNIDVSSVHKVNIRNGYLHDFKKYVKMFSNAEVFRYHNGGVLYSERVFLQTRWKCLHIRSMLHGDELLSICRVLTISPLLEEFVVYTDSEHLGKTCYKSMLSIELPSCLMQQLKTVTMRGYKIPCYGLLRLAEFLLKSSVNLEKLVVIPNKYRSTKFKPKILRQLLSFPRASTNARIIFGPEHCEKVGSTRE